jgi:DNA-directed RNA polymerase specialized sigma24 family protein
VNAGQAVGLAGGAASPTAAPGDAEARRLAEGRLRDRLAEAGFRGRDYERFQDELVRYGLQVVTNWIRNGKIVEKARQRGVPGLRPPPPTLAADAEDLAVETLARALPRFREQALVAGGWDPDAGASLTTYFMGTCLYSFAEAYRAWCRADDRRQKERLAAEEAYRLAASCACGPEDTALGPEDTALARLAVAERLSSGSRAERAKFLQAAGYSHKEIGEMLGTTARAVEGLLRRQRRRPDRRPPPDIPGTRRDPPH